MSSSFQSEMPKARINITLDVDTGDAKQKKELPMKMLMLGDYSCGKAIGPIVSRERVSVNRDNFNQVMEDLSPQVSLSVPNHVQPDNNDLNINLNFNHIKDFGPERVVNQVPVLKKLLAMRNLLKDLKASVLDNQQFRRELENILKDEQGKKELKQELHKLMSSVE